MVSRGARRTAISKKTISIEEAAKVAPNGDPAQVVKLLPGVQSTGFRADVAIQGSGPHDSRYFIDDLEVPIIFHNFGNLSIIPGSMLKSVDFETAGFGPEYGDATGGIIVLHTVSDIPERPLTQAIVNVPFYSGVYHTRPLSEDSSLTVGVRRSYIDFFINQVLKGQSSGGGGKSRGTTTISPYFSDGQVQYLKKDDKGGHTKVTMLTAIDGLKAAAPSDQSTQDSGNADIDISTRFVNLGVERETSLGDGWRLRTTPQLYYYQQNNDFNGQNNDNNTTAFRIPTEATLRLSKTEEAYVGVDPAVFMTRTDIYAVQQRRDDPTFDPLDATPTKSVDTARYSTVGAWGNVDHAFGDVIVSPGLRGMYNSQISKVAADPRLRSRYLVNEEQTVKAAVGQYSESPTASQASRGVGNPDLNFIHAMHYVLGLETRWNDMWTSEFQVFYKTAYNLINSDNTINFNNNRRMRTKGFEAFIRRNLTGRIFGWLSYTYSKTEEQQNSDAPWASAQYDQTHVLTAVGDYKFTGTFDLGMRYNYNTGNTYSTVSDSVFNADHDKYQQRPTPDDKNAGRVSPYNALTVYLNKDFLYDTWKLSVKGGMEQYWFRPQTAMVRYSYDYTEQVPITTLTSIPFLEARGEF